MKRLALVLGIAGLYIQTAQAAPSLVRCTVDGIDPVRALFGGAGLPLEKGDKIDIDLKPNEITDLTFESGASIALKSVKAKLIKKTVLGADYYEGTYKSKTSDYTGIFSLRHGGKESYGFIQVLRKKFNGPMTLSTAELSCTHLN